MSMSKITNTLALVAALISNVAGHTSVEEWEVGGVTYPGYYQGSKVDPGNKSPAWWTNQGWGYQPVLGSSLNDADIIAHVDASPSPYTAPAPAGEDVTFTWHHSGTCGGDELGWDCSHHGWTATYLAPCNGDCADVEKTDLLFFKIHEAGLIDYRKGRYSTGTAQEQTGYWGTDAIFYTNGNKQTVKIPSDIPSGNYVLRTEVMSIHNNGAVAERQFWPQAFNIKVTGGDDSASVPTGVKGTELYSVTDELLTWNLYWHETKDTSIAAAGPSISAAILANVGKKTRRHAKDFSS